MKETLSWAAIQALESTSRDLGIKIHTVTSSVFPCPWCKAAATRLDIYEEAAMWPCGHVRVLPPLHGGKKATEACRHCTPPEVTAGQVLQFLRKSA